MIFLHKLNICVATHFFFFHINQQVYFFSFCMYINMMTSDALNGKNPDKNQ